MTSHAHQMRFFDLSISVLSFGKVVLWLPVLFCQKHRVPCADFSQQSHLNPLGGVMIGKAQLLLHTSALDVSIVISAPNALHAKLLEGVAKHLARGFGNESPPPEGLPDPIPKLKVITASSAADARTTKNSFHSFWHFCRTADFGYGFVKLICYTIRLCVI